MSQLHMSHLVASCHGWMCQPGCANAENAPGHRGAEQHPSSLPKVFQRPGSLAPNDQLATAGATAGATKCDTLTRQSALQ